MAIIKILKPPKNDYLGFGVKLLTTLFPLMTFVFQKCYECNFRCYSDGEMKTHAVTRYRDNKMGNSGGFSHTESWPQNVLCSKKSMKV